jgi:rhomboid protease GluP
MAHAQSSAPLRTGRAAAIKQVPLTSVLIGVNILVFLAMALSRVSLANPSIGDLVRWGANNGADTLHLQPWRMLTSNYVHIGLLHIAFNMWCLWSLGGLAERVFDRWTYFLTYTFCGLAGSLVSISLHPTRIGAGASGAIFGLAGALISALYLGHLPVHPSALKATLKSLLSFAGYNLFFGALVPAIDNSAHIGGLITGLALGAALAPHLSSPPEERSAWNRWIFILTAALFLVAYYFAQRMVHPSVLYQ